MHSPWRWESTWWGKGQSRRWLRSVLQWYWSDRRTGRTRSSWTGRPLEGREGGRQLVKFALQQHIFKMKAQGNFCWMTEYWFQLSHISSIKNVCMRQTYWKRPTWRFHRSRLEADQRHWNHLWEGIHHPNMNTHKPHVDITQVCLKYTVTGVPLLKSCKKGRRRDLGIPNSKRSVCVCECLSSPVASPPQWR